MYFSTDMNSSLVLLKLDVKLIFCHISHNGILFAVSFRAVNFWIQEFKSCPESLVAFLIMEPSVLFHSKLWMLNWWANWISCLISTMEFSLKATCQHGFLVDLYGSLICIDFIMDMNSSLVLLKFFCLLWIFCHVSHNGILFAVSFKATCHSRLVLSNPDVKLKWLMY